MSEVKTALVGLIKPLKHELGKNAETATCTHIITWGYTVKSQLAWDGDFIYCYEQQVDDALKKLASYAEVDGVIVSRITVEKTMHEGVVETV